MGRIVLYGLSGTVFIVLAIVVDGVSVFLGLRRVRGNGPSGFPVIGVLLFAAGLLCYHSSGLIGSAAMKDGIRVYACAHIALHFVLPLIVYLLPPRK